jgi:Spy/CpxP family protein refolding chaperone
MLRKALVASALLLCTASVIAQEAPPDSSTAPPPPPARHGGMPHCLRAAGISTPVFDQLRSIEQDARAQVRGVCTDASLTQQQKRGQIHDIHQTSHQKMAALVTPDQGRMFMACRAQRGDRRPVEWFERPGGGCGAPRRAGAASYEPLSPYSQPNENVHGGENNPPARNDAPPQKSESSPQ